MWDDTDDLDGLDDHGGAHDPLSPAHDGGLDGATVSSVGLYDTDGDGVVDAVAADTTGDGWMDALEADTDGDGVVDAVAADTTGDGWMDMVGVDTDGDGVVDVVGADTTGDGVGDWWVADSDGDGTADVAVTVTEVGAADPSAGPTWDTTTTPGSDYEAVPGPDPMTSVDTAMSSDTAAVLDSVNAGMGDASAIYHDAMDPGSVDQGQVDEAYADTGNVAQANIVNDGLVTGQEMHNDAMSDMSSMQDTWHAEEAAAEVALDADRASWAADDALGDA